MNESAWQKIFMSSPANGANYAEPIGRHVINWPTNTYLQRRLAELRRQQKDAPKQEKTEH